MTPSRATGYTLFFMVYDFEAILPTDLDYGALRVKAYDKQGAKVDREDAMEQLDQARNIALVHSAKYQQALRWNRSRRVRSQAFNIGDLVLHLIQTSKDHHKLSLPWEGPYVIAEVLRPGAYKLMTIDGGVFANAWNIKQLRHFYP